MNQIVLMGRMTKDIELVKKGKKKEAKVYGRFSLAVPRKMDRETVDFINCVAFGKLAELIKEYVGKGKRILVSGSLQLSSYEDEDGNKRTNSLVIVNDIEFIDFKDEDDDEDEKPKKKSKKEIKKRKL